MKKMLLLLITILILPLTSYAGDYDTALLADDNAQLFFGELISYNNEGEISYLEVIPKEKIKGDVILYTVCTYQNVEITEDIELKEGITYLFAAQNYMGGTRRIHNIMVFEITSTDLRTLKIKGHGNWDGDPTTRIEKMLNNGDYERAEIERLKRLSSEKKYAKEGEVTLAELLGITENNIKKVHIYVENKRYEISPYKIFSVSNIIFTPVINCSPLYTSGIYITVDKEDSPISYIYVTNDGYADIYAPFISRVPQGIYKIKHQQDLKYLIINILPDDVEFEIPAKKSFQFDILIMIAFAVVLIIFFVIRKRVVINND